MSPLKTDRNSAKRPLPGYLKCGAAPLPSAHYFGIGFPTSASAASDRSPISSPFLFLRESLSRHGRRLPPRYLDAVTSLPHRDPSSRVHSRSRRIRWQMTSATRSAVKAASINRRSPSKYYPTAKRGSRDSAKFVFRGSHSTNSNVRSTCVMKRLL